MTTTETQDENTMPPELRRAHQDNDRAVMAAYGFVAISLLPIPRECGVKLSK